MVRSPKALLKAAVMEAFMSLEMLWDLFKDPELRDCSVS